MSDLSFARASAVGLLATLVALTSSASAQPARAYPERAPLQQYVIQDEAAEVALARSAAPASISEKAEVQVLGEAGYRVATSGTNGFVCMVWRSWSDDIDDPQFWNPAVRAPICLNPIAVRSVLPDYLQRTGWALSGLPRSEIKSRFEAAASADRLRSPAPGSMSYMMSHAGYLADGVGPASPHIMFFVPREERQDWGANSSGSPISGAAAAPDPVGIFFVSVPRWSDGTLAVHPADHQH